MYIVNRGGKTWDKTNYDKFLTYLSSFMTLCFYVATTYKESNRLIQVLESSDLLLSLK